MPRQVTADADPFDDDPEIAAAERAVGLRHSRPGDSESRSVQIWNERLSPLLDLAPSVPPDDRVWRSIAHRLDQIAERSALRTTRSLSRWRFGAMSAAAIAIALLAILIGLLRASSSQSELPSIATLAPDNAAPIVTAVYNYDRHILTIDPAASQIVRVKSPELWFVPPTGSPVSLGVIDLSQRSELDIPIRLRTGLRKEGNLAISLEPPGGSPSGAPTGPIVAHGHFSAYP